MEDRDRIVEETFGRDCVDMVHLGGEGDPVVGRNRTKIPKRKTGYIVRKCNGS